MPYLKQFVVYIHYVGYSPFYRVSFTLKLVYTIYLRELEEEVREQNVTTICDYTGQFDTSTRIALYNCSADAEHWPNTTESYNDFKFYTKDGRYVPIDIEDINFSLDAAIASHNLTVQTQNFTSFVSIDNATFYTNDSSLFYIKEKLAGTDRDKVAEQDKITFTFYDTPPSGGRVPYNVTCDVINKDVDDFHLKCEPQYNITGYQFEANGTVDDIGITLNTTDHYDYIDIAKNNGYSNVRWRKNYSGLSGGAIAGIVIASAVVLILITILAMFCRRSKVVETNNSTIVGLKSIDNNNE